MSGNKIFMGALFFLFLLSASFAEEVKKPEVAGSFYPDDPQRLADMLDNMLRVAVPTPVGSRILGLISPHAGYGYSGQAAAYGYSLVKGAPYKTVVIIGCAHRYGFPGVSVYKEGAFLTPLGAVQIDEGFARRLLGKDKEIYFEKRAFAGEHSVEVQIPFLQRVIPQGFKIVPIVTGDCSIQTCKKLATLISEAIGVREDVLVVASTDLYHGYSYRQAQENDERLLSSLKKLDPDELYQGIRSQRYQLCGGMGVVALLELSRQMGFDNIRLLRSYNSADLTGEKEKKTWIVGYASLAVFKKKEGYMLNEGQMKKLLKLARDSLATYLKTGKKLEVSEDDPLLSSQMGAFVTLHEHGQLRGCIGNIIGRQPLYLTVRDMAVEAGVGDPRFLPVEAGQLKDLEFEISVLSPLERVDSADKIEMGVHGVLVKKGFNSGVFLPQVATETGWSKEEFLSELCAHKAGLRADAWKDKSTEIYTFRAQVFSEKDR